MATPGKLQNSFKVFGAKPLEDVVSFFLINIVFHENISHVSDIFGIYHMHGRSELCIQNFCPTQEM